MKILQFADVHARDNEIDEVEKCLKEIVQTAYTECPDLIIMSGDTFDSRMVKLDSLSTKLIFRAYSELADRAPMVVITGTPYHDGLAPKVLANVRSQHPVYVSDRPEQILLTYGGGFANPRIAKSSAGDIMVALISCVPTPTKQYWEQFGGEGKSAKESDMEIARAMSGLLANFGAEASALDCPHVLVGHFTVGGAFLSETQQLTGVDIELSRDQIALANADLVCLGHIHYPQEIKPNIFYSGSIYTKDYGELHPHGFYVHELDGKNLMDSRFIPTPTRKLVRIKSDFTDHPIEELDLEAYSLSPEELDGAHLRIELRLYQDEITKIDKNQIIEYYKAGGAIDVDIQINSVPRETIRATTILDATTLRDKIREMGLLRKEEVPESILKKADMLEHTEPDELYRALSNA